MKIEDIEIVRVISYTKNKVRAQKEIEELLRIGINIDKIIPMYNFPNPFDRVIINNTNHRNICNDVGFFNAMFNHYRTIKITYELNFNNVLIVEDDCRFLNDIRQINIILDDLPNDYDVALLDSFKPQIISIEQFKNMQSNIVSNNWARFNMIRSGACYILSRPGMERLIYLYESCITDKKYKMRVCDQWFEEQFLSGLNLYFSVPNAAIQVNTNQATNSNYKDIENFYINIGLNINNYQKY